MNIKITQTQTQKQILAPYMQKSIEVLLLPLVELNLAIQQELDINPLLETQDDTVREESEDDADMEEKIKSLENTMDIPYRHGENNTEEFPEERLLKEAESLEDDLLRQLRIETADPLKIEIGALIIGNLDDDGYLKTTCEEIATFLNLRDIKKIEEVLRLVQGFDPPGIAARDLKECLLAQIRAKIDPADQATLTAIVTDHLGDLGKKRHKRIARQLSLPLERVKEAAKKIGDLDPRPARNYRPILPYIYIKPDVTITCAEDNEYRILINERDIPKLRVNRRYKSMLKQKSLNAAERKFIREKLKNALYFIRSVHQRGQTIREIARFIVERQKDFFLNGHMSLVPMSLKDVANDLGRNESTISRAIHNKYIDTPQGLFPMKFFFSQAVGKNTTAAAPETSNRSIKEEIRRLVEEENKKSPLSDQAIRKYFEEKGMTIARRTISKYRQALRILPSHLRKE